MIIWILFIFVFFSLSSSQLIPYIAPIFLPIAVMMGHLFRVFVDQKQYLETGKEGGFLYHLPVLILSLLGIVLLIMFPFIPHLKWNRWTTDGVFEKWWLAIPPIFSLIFLGFLPGTIQRRWKKGWFPTIYFLSVVFLGSIVFPLAHFLTPYKSAYPVSQAIHQYLPANQELFQFRISLYGIDFYNKIRTPLVDACGELKFGFLHLSSEERNRYYLSPEDLFRICRERGEIYCVTRSGVNVEYLRRRVSDLKVLWDNNEFFLLRLRC